MTIYSGIFKEFYVPNENFKKFFQFVYAISTFRWFINESNTVNAMYTVYSGCICHYGPQVMKFEPVTQLI